MNAIPYESREEDWDRYDGDLDEELPRRPRRQFLNKWSALLVAVILGGIGFYAGIRVEKGQLANSSASVPSTLASRFGGAAGATGAAGASRAGGASGAAGRFGGGAGGGFAALFGGAGGNAVGTVSSVNGNTLYVTETSGNTVKVTLSSATKITKNEPVSKSKVYPGDSVVIAGAKGAKGTVSATTLTDSGTRSTGSGSTAGSGSSSGGSAVSSLFGGG